MDFTTLLPFLVVLACPIVMGGMMWYMMRQGSQSSMSMSAPPPATPDQQLAALQRHKEALEMQIRELEATQFLQARLAQLEREAATRPAPAKPTEGVQA
jgi:hypothetical protein